MISASEASPSCRSSLDDNGLALDTRETSSHFYDMNGDGLFYRTAWAEDGRDPVDGDASITIA